MSFTRMDRGTIEEWTTVGHKVGQWQSALPERIKATLLQLEALYLGHQVSQLQHGLQTATRAVRDGASEELIVGALCHDIANVISVENHPAIAAAILRPYVSNDVYQIVRTHQHFSWEHYPAAFGKDTEAWRQYAKQPWYEMARRFSDWDQRSFDPDYDTFSLEYFEPMMDRTFRECKPGWTQRGGRKGSRWVTTKYVVQKLYHTLKHRKKRAASSTDFPSIG